MIADGQGEISPLSVSLLYACNDGIDFRPLLDQLEGLGVEACRWFASKLTPGEFRTGNSLENAELRSVDVAQELNFRKMWGHAVGFADTKSWPEWAGLEAHARWFGKFLVGRRWNIGELINEHQHSTQVDFSIEQMSTLARIVREQGYEGPLTAGAWLKSDELVGGTYRPGEVQGCDVIDTHIQRTNDPAWDMANHGFAELRVIQSVYKKMARLSGEPKRTDDNIFPRRLWPFLLGVEAQGFNTWTTLHSSQLRDCQVLTGEQLEDVKTFIAAGHLLPRGRYHYENAGWGSSPIKGAAFVEGSSTNSAEKNVWRDHSFQHIATGQWFEVIYGPNIDRPFNEFQNSFRRDVLIGKLDQHAEVWTLKQD